MPFFCDGLSGLTHTAGMTSPSSRREIRQPFAMPPSIFHFANVTRIAMSASSKSLLTISPSSGMRSAWYSENNSASGSCGSASSQTWAFTFSNAGFVVSSVAWNVLSECRSIDSGGIWILSSGIVSRNDWFSSQWVNHG